MVGELVNPFELVERTATFQFTPLTSGRLCAPW